MEQPLFSFDSIPEELCEQAAPSKRSSSPSDGRNVKLQRGNVISEPIRSAVERTYAAAQDNTRLPCRALVGLNLGEVFLAKSWLEDRPAWSPPWLEACHAEKIAEVRAMVVQVPVSRRERADPGCPANCCRRGSPVSHQLAAATCASNSTNRTTKRPYRC